MTSAKKKIDKVSIAFTSSNFILFELNDLNY